MIVIFGFVTFTLVSHLSHWQYKKNIISAALRKANKFLLAQATSSEPESENMVLESKFSLTKINSASEKDKTLHIVKKFT